MSKDTIPDEGEREQQLNEIRARHEASTKGPYRWYGYVRGRGVKESRAKERKCERLYLATVHGGRIFVMDFEKVGFSNAQPRFQDYKGREFGIMRGAGELIEAFKTYSGEMTGGIENPDATAIERSWEDRQFLLDEIDSLRARVSDLSEKWMHLRCEYVDCAKPGPHDSHSTGGTATAVIDPPLKRLLNELGS